MVTRIAKVFTAELDVVYRRHAVKRMFEQSISDDEVAQLFSNASEIVNYPDDKPFPSKLICGYAGDSCLHSVISVDEQNKVLYVITVYQPDPALWEEGFLRRKK